MNRSTPRTTVQEDNRLLRKERLEPFLETLLEERLLFAPVKKGDVLLFERIASARDVVLDNLRNTTTSPKGALFPQTERLFAYRRDREGITIDQASAADKERVLFGIRPCDARAHLLLDRIFGDSREDPYYTEKRQRTVVVSAACTQPDAACFCGAVGGGPCSPLGSDLLLLDLGDTYLVEAVSDKGRRLFDHEFLEDADEESVVRAAIIKNRAESLMKPTELWEGLTAEGLDKHLDALFDDPAWNNLTESCLGCGICTYLCPTCHCFDISDEAGPVTGERIRTWDSCQFPLFTRQASGFNPRPTAKERFRQRIMHKFSYLPKNVGMIGCVGCGRCVTECPVNLDFREVLLALSEK